MCLDPHVSRIDLDGETSLPFFFFFWHMHMFAVAEGLAHLRSGELKPMALMSS